MVMGDWLLRVRVSSLQTRNVIRGSMLSPMCQDLMERMTPRMMITIFCFMLVLEQMTLPEKYFMQERKRAWSTDNVFNHYFK